MKNLKKTFRLSCWLLICLLVFSLTESKAQVKKMSAKDLTEASTTVLYGNCKKIKCEWNESRSAIFTYITIAPEGYIKGSLGSEVIVAVPGGRVDDILYEVSETPVFMEGEDAVVFIWTNPKGKNLVTGGYQGKMKIEKDTKTGKRFVTDPDIDSETGTVNMISGQIKQAEKIGLEDFVIKLRGYQKN